METTKFTCQIENRSYRGGRSWLPMNPHNEPFQGPLADKLKSHLLFSWTSSSDEGTLEGFLTPDEVEELKEALGEKTDFLPCGRFIQGLDRVIPLEVLRAKDIKKNLPNLKVLLNYNHELAIKTSSLIQNPKEIKMSNLELLMWDAWNESLYMTNGDKRTFKFDTMNVELVKRGSIILLTLTANDVIK